MLNEIISVVLQLLIFTLIPLVVYLIREKAFKGFFNNIGIKHSNTKVNLRAVAYSTVLFVPILIMVIVSPDFKAIMHNSESITRKFHDMGFGIQSAVLVVITAVFKTALAEEILFRGFIAKRLIAITSYKTGNLIQALLFGTIHMLLFLNASSNPLFLIIIFLFPTLGSYLMVYLNEKKSNGSIIPGWIMHCTANLFSYFVVGFLV